MRLYQIEVKFNDNTADLGTYKRYFEVVDKYDALATGNDKIGISTLRIKTEGKLARKVLQKALGDIPIKSFSSVSV